MWEYGSTHIHITADIVTQYFSTIDHPSTITKRGGALLREELMAAAERGGASTKPRPQSIGLGDSDLPVCI